jgi:hypothetical protein
MFVEVLSLTYHSPITIVVDLIRFGGHLLKGRYDVHNGKCKEPAVSPAVHG